MDRTEVLVRNNGYSPASGPVERVQCSPGPETMDHKDLTFINIGGERWTFTFVGPD